MRFKCPHCKQQWIDTDVKTLLWFSVSCSNCHFPIQPEEIEPSILTEIKISGFDLCRKFMRLTTILREQGMQKKLIPMYHYQAKMLAGTLLHYDRVVERIETLQNQNNNHSGGES